MEIAFISQQANFQRGLELERDRRAPGALSPDPILGLVGKSRELEVPSALILRWALHPPREVPTPSHEGEQEKARPREAMNDTENCMSLGSQLWGA